MSMLGSDHHLTFRFQQDEVPALSTTEIECRIPIFMAVDRVVLPKAMIGRFAIRGFRTGMYHLTDEWDVERFVTLEGPSPFGTFDVFPGQSVRIIVTNLTEEPAPFLDALVRGKHLVGRFLLDQTLHALRDRGKALEACDDTRVYARGWQGAIDALEERMNPFRSLALSSSEDVSLESAVNPARPYPMR